LVHGSGDILWLVPLPVGILYVCRMGTKRTAHFI
jgi:hypothetical protein